MSINPSDYDLDELRKMARERGGEPTGDTERGDRDASPGTGSMVGSDVGSPGNSFRAGLYRELLPLEAGSDASKPYLKALPEHYAGENLVFDWLEFLLLHAGYKGAMDALDYYESVDWITEDVESTLNDYLVGLDDAGATDPSDLDVDDHLLSLVYIAKLVSMR